MVAFRAAWPTFVAACALGACGRHGADPDTKLRDQWISHETAAHAVYLRRFLNGTGDTVYFDGWYPLENDPKTGAAWRWMKERSITRLYTGAPDARDMIITIYGWTAAKDLWPRTDYMDFSVNGYLLEHFEPPKGSFQHSIFVPRFLLEHSSWVDFVIKVANSVIPRGDWREIAFATTGIVWKRADGK
jgi:hypothetical protein